jgi:DNA polymerase I-like protein with 3'-5' exonuclease and polymerase domains
MTTSLGDRVDGALRAVAKSPVIAYDVETSGVDWRRNAVVGYVITVDEQSNWYIPVRHGGGGNLLDGAPLTDAVVPRPMPVHPFEEALARAFSERNRRGYVTVGHNIKFDVHLSANHGVMLGRNLNCTQITEALIDEYAGSYSLDACCKRHGVTEKKGDALYAHMAQLFGGEPERKIMQHFWRLAGDDAVAVDYAMGDGTSTLDLWRSQAEDVTAEDKDGKTLENIFRLENELIWTVFRLERIGMKVDEGRLDWAFREVKRLVSEARADAGFDESFNVRSTSAVKDWLISKGVVDFPRTEPTARFPDGQISIRAKWLEGHAVGQPVVAIRNALDLESKFLSPLKERHLFEGRVHASLNQLRQDDYGTVTGRFSCNEPNLQQISKRNKKLGKILRSVFVPDEDKILYEADYSQAEPRTFAHYTQSPKIMEGYLRTPFVDMHSVVAQELGVDRGTVGKRLNMGMLTGLGPTTLAEHMEWPVARAREVWDWYMTKFFPELKQFHGNASKIYKSRGFVRTMLGRRCNLKDPKFAYQAVSRIIQGSGADIIKYKLLEADKMCEADGDEVNVIMTIHDSFVFQAPPEKQEFVDQLIARMSSVQEDPFNMRVPFLMDVGKGENWAIASYGDK